VNQQKCIDHHSRILSLIFIISSFLVYSKAHEPFVYNDLSPYFDTTIVERAIHEVN